MTSPDDPNENSAAEAFVMGHIGRPGDVLSPSGSSPQPESTSRGRLRVRFNSRAAEQAPPDDWEGYQKVNMDQDPPSNETEPSHRAVTDEAEELLQAHWRRMSEESTAVASAPSEGTPAADDEDPGIGSPFDGYAVSGNNHGGVFYHILQTYKQQTSMPVYEPAPTPSPPEKTSGTSSADIGGGSATPARRKWYEQNRSQETLSQLIGASRQLANPNEKTATAASTSSRSPSAGPRSRPGHKRTTSGRIMSLVGAAGVGRNNNKNDRDAVIKIHVANILQRQKYLIRMCRALMLFGAPTHRLEEYMATTAKVLEINSQFLYIPGCMIVSFDDVLTHTAEVKIVRVAQGVNLGKLKDLHQVYKEVLHDVITLDEALERLDGLLSSTDQHPVWLCVLMYGLASTAVSCFFQARPIDLPVIFVLGTLLGVLQLVVAPLSKTYSTVFEVSSAILLTFLSRALASIQGGSIFCFSALAQSSIAMILPGWLVLSSALELQSKAIVPGAIRMVHAIIYSLFLGYGITVGTALYGAIDSNATTQTKCQNPLNSYWNFLFVPLYIFFVSFTVQAKYKQMPVMIAIAMAGYVVNFWSSQRFSASAPIAYTFGALTVGVLANLYSRLRHGVAAAVLLPAVYVQVPGSLASSGAIVSGLNTAALLIKPGESAASQSQDEQLNAIVFNVAASMIQIAIGITVGLFMSALVIYPMGKRRSGLWTL